MGRSTGNQLTHDVPTSTVRRPEGDKTKNSQSGKSVFAENISRLISQKRIKLATFRFPNNCSTIDGFLEDKALKWTPTVARTPISLTQNN